MGKEEFSIVLQVPPLAGIPGKVWGQMPEYQGWVEGMDLGYSRTNMLDMGPKLWLADNRSGLRLCQTQH